MDFPVFDRLLTNDEFAQMDYLSMMILLKNSDLLLRFLRTHEDGFPFDVFAQGVSALLGAVRFIDDNFVDG